MQTHGNHFWNLPIMDDPIGPLTPLAADLKVMLYLAASSALGMMSALASVLGNEGQVLSCRVVCAYLIAGGLVAAGITFMLIQYYGFSYFLLGVSIFAGYKAFDTMAFISLSITGLVKRFLSKK
jgi:hypothetical protein